MPLLHSVVVRNLRSSLKAANLAIHQAIYHILNRQAIPMIYKKNEHDIPYCCHVEGLINEQFAGHSVAGAEPCHNCSRISGLAVVSTAPGSWDDYATQQCQKYANKLDIKQRRIIYYTRRCPSCGYTDVIYSYEYRIVCAH